MSSYAKARQRYEDKNQDEDETPAPPLAKCMATDCPMAAGLSLGGSKRGPQWCAYHHACPSDDLARVTSVLNQHKDLRDVVNAARGFVGHDNVDESKVPGEHRRLLELFRFAGYTAPEVEQARSLTEFGYRCEALLGGFVVEAMRSLKRRAA